MNYNGLGSGDRDALTVTTGVVVPNVLATGCTLAASTYYFPAGSGNAVTSAETALVAFHVKWSAAVTGTITVESCSFPKYLNGADAGAFDVSDYDATAGNWIQENPSTAIVAVTGTGNTSTAMTVTMGGTNAGGCVFHIGNVGTKRLRLKIVTSVGGIVRVNVCGKFGT